MTAKQRLRAVFTGQTPDRVPVCEQGFASSVASKILGYEAFTGSTDLHYFEACAWMDGDTAHDEFEDKCFADVAALHRKLRYDIFFLPWRMRERPSKRLDETTFLYGDPDGDNWRVYTYDPHSRTYGLQKTARDGDDGETVLARIRQEVDGFDGTGKPGVDEFLLRAVRELGDEFEVAGAAFCALPIQPAWLEAAALDPGLLTEWFKIQGYWQAAAIRAQAEAGIWLINGGGDLAFNTGLVYSPAFFRRAVLPSFQAHFNAARESGMQYIFRSDGNIWAITDDLFCSGGAAAYYEIEHEAGMTFDKLRARYPELVLFGNVGCDLLHSGTVDEVSARARWCVEQAAPRLVLGSANSILHGTPPENVWAMLDCR
jgi:hypothetical protein